MELVLEIQIYMDAQGLLQNPRRTLVAVPPALRPFRLAISVRFQRVSVG